MELLKKIKGFKPLYVNSDGTLWASNYYKILLSKDNGSTFQSVGFLKSNWKERLQGKHRLSRRLFRSGFHRLLPLDNGELLGIIHKGIVRLKTGEKVFKKVFDIPRGTRPLNICKTPDEKIFFGEYFSNPNRDAVHVYGTEDGGKTWDVVYTFGRGEIRHIHGIFYDKYRKGCWVLTGDIGKECRIAFTDDEFRNLTTIFSGSQRFRAVTIIIRPRGLILPTDTPLDNNYILWIDLKHHHIEELFPLPGSVFHSGISEDYLCISTVIEPSDINKCNYASIFISKDYGKKWIELYRQKKDFWSMRYFQFGTFQMPDGESQQPILYASGQALCQDDENMIIFDLQK